MKEKEYKMGIDYGYSVPVYKSYLSSDGTVTWWQENGHKVWFGIWIIFCVSFPFILVGILFYIST